MILPLFALGLLTAGTGIAKGLYDETQEQKRKQKMLDALLGPAETLADPVGASQRHVAQSGNPFGISRQAQATLGADPRAVSQQVRRANVDAVRAIGIADPMAAFTMAQSMAQPKAPIAVPKDTVLLNPDTLTPEFDNRTPDRPANPSMLPIYNRNGDLVKTINQNDPVMLAKYQSGLESGFYTTVKPEKADKPAPMTALAKLEADLRNGFINQDQYNAEVERVIKPGQKFTDAQEKTRGYHSVVTGAENELNSLLTEVATKNNKFKKDGSPDISTSISEVVPSAYQLYLPSRTRPELLNSNQLRYLQSADEWTTAVLRDESGATIGDQERADAYVTYFPLKGDSAEVIEAKQRSRARKMKAMAGKFANGERAQTYNPMTGNFE